MLANAIPPDSCNEEFLQILSTMLIQLNALQMMVSEEVAEERIDIHAVRGGLKILEHMTREALYVVRASDEDLSSANLADNTLSEALSRLTEETAEMLGISSHVSFSGIDGQQGQPAEHVLSSSAERILYLIAHETLHHIEQHSGTRRLRLLLNYGPEDVQMSIEDDGLNLDQQVIEENSTSAPPFTVSAAAIVVPVMRTLHNRIEQLGGVLEVSPLEERGTRVFVRVPYVAHTTENLEYANRAPLVPAEATIPPAAPLPAETVRVLVVDRQAITRAGLQRLLESYAGLQVVGQAADGVQAVSETLELGPHVVLMDAQLPDGQSLEALRQIKQLNLDTRVLLFLTQEREEYVYETLRAGADGYVLKDIAPDELAQAIYAVARGEMLIQPQIAGKLLSRVGRRGKAPHESLTARELEVLRLLARGLRNKEMAARLFVSERTVNFHLANIYQKLNVSGRTEALSKALEYGLIIA